MQLKNGVPVSCWFWHAVVPTAAIYTHFTLLTFDYNCIRLCVGVLYGVMWANNGEFQLQLVVPFSTSSSSRWVLSTSCIRPHCVSSFKCSICRWHDPPSRQSQRNVSRTSLSVWRSARSHTQLEASTRRTSSSSPSSWRSRFSCRRKPSSLKSSSASSKVEISF